MASFALAHNQAALICNISVMPIQLWYSHWTMPANPALPTFNNVLLRLSFRSSWGPEQQRYGFLFSNKNQKSNIMKTAQCKRSTCAGCLPTALQSPERKSTPVHTGVGSRGKAARHSDSHEEGRHPEAMAEKSSLYIFDSQIKFT